MAVVRTASGSIRTEVLQQAAEWLVRLNDEGVGDADRQAWRQWLQGSEEHARAWQRAEQLSGLLGDVPAAVGSAPLRHATRPGRRAAVAAIAGLLAGAPLAWLTVRREPWQYLASDYDCGIGQQRRFRLDDGSQLHLNTDSRVDLRYGSEERCLRLLRGELLVQTAPDPQAPARPFRVQTRHGLLQALGTRFAVRLYEDRSRVAVEQGAVRITPAAQPQHARIVHAGQQAEFGASEIAPAAPLRRLAMDWAQGILNAENMPLGEVAAELARYRPGILRCDPQVAGIRVSGVFQLADTDKALRLLQDTFRVRLRYRSRYWVTVGPR